VPSAPPGLTVPKSLFVALPLIVPVPARTDPKKGFFVILRLYSPLESFFTKKWRPSEIELVK
jgi:hypothetical protein